MAIYHCHAKTGSKAKGQSAKAKHDYNARVGKYEAHGEKPIFCYSGNMPAFAQEDPQIYWEVADIYERSNGRLFKEVEFALPRELNKNQKIKLAQDIAQNICGDKLPFSLAIHPGKNNPHVHLQISERENDKIERGPEQWFKRYNKKDPGKGGARKSEDLKPKAWLEQTRELISTKTNEHLARAGIDAKIDHRSYEAQGKTEIPSKHLGPTALAYEERSGEKSERRLYFESLREEIEYKRKKVESYAKDLMSKIAGHSRHFINEERIKKQEIKEYMSSLANNSRKKIRLEELKEQQLKQQTNISHKTRNEEKENSSVHRLSM